jgi:5-methylcytosine-specific restriction endonuclease McrA
MRDKEKQRVYNAKWRAEHKEWIRQYQAANKVAIDAQVAKYRADHPEARKATTRKYRESHKEQQKEYNVKRKAKSTAYHREYRKDHREPDRAYAAKVRREHPEVKAVSEARRSARKRCTAINDLTVAQWRERVAEFNGYCAYCLQPMATVTQDHMTPLSRGGSHTLSNAIPCCLSCNSKKHTKTLLEYVAVMT